MTRGAYCDRDGLRDRPRGRSRSRRSNSQTMERQRDTLCGQRGWRPDHGDARPDGRCGPSRGIGAITKRYAGPPLPEDPDARRRVLDAYRVQRHDVEDAMNQMLGRDPELHRPPRLSWGPLIELLAEHGKVAFEEELIAMPFLFEFLRRARGSEKNNRRSGASVYMVRDHVGARSRRTARSGIVGAQPESSWSTERAPRPRSRSLLARRRCSSRWWRRGTRG